MLTLRIGRRTFTVVDLAEASVVYQRERDASGKGASGFPIGRVGDHHVSYNGRVWRGEWQPGATPVLEAQPYNRERSS